MRRFTLEMVRIHACSAYQNSVYILNLICRSINKSALRKESMHVGSTHGSSVYLIKYFLVAPICYCRVLGSGYYILVTVFWMIRLMGCQSDWLIRLWLVQKVIGWCRYIWWLNYTYDVIDGFSLKIYETWSLEEKEKVVAFCRSTPTY